MPIPEEQLRIWSHQGGVANSQAAHLAIRDALEAPNSPVLEMDLDVFLQGSYRNDTNVRADSDVDVVVQLNSTFGYDVGNIAAAQARAFDATFPNSTYTWEQFRGEVLRALRASYGAAAVQERNRCLKVSAAPGRLAADVVPAFQFRKYVYFYDADHQGYIEGIRFRTHGGQTIVNFPKAHYANGVEKNSDAHTHGRYKPAVRMFKNARTSAAERGYLHDEVAPSYFVDCLIWNVPDQHFAPGHRELYCNAVNFLNRSSFDGFLCRNGLVPLFGTSPEQWSEASARQLLAALIRLWNEW